MDKRAREEKEYRQQMYVERKNRWNELNDNLSEEQHEAIQSLCAARHWMHVNAVDIAMGKSFEDEKLNDLIHSKLNDELIECGFDKIEGLKDYQDVYPEDMFVDVYDAEHEDTARELYERDEDSYYNERDKYIFENYDKTSEICEHNDKIIIEYLKEIDEKYGTEYCPTGMSRRIV